MKRRLSSKITFVSKIVIPSVAIFVWVFAIFPIVLGLGTEDQLPLPLIVRILFPALALVAVTVLFWLSTGLKVVAADDEGLYITNYLKEIFVPFSNIRDITELRLRGHPVTVHFKEKTEFGGRLTFLPRMKFFNFAKTHPVVAELKQLANIES